MMRATIIASLATAALGSGLARQNRKLSTDISTTGTGLCASANILEVPTQSICQSPGILSLSEVNWQPCCSFSSASAEACRTFTMGAPYCVSPDNLPSCLPQESVSGMATCDQLTSEDKMTMSLSFDVQIGDEDCCKSCTCFGDPECQSFRGVDDLWIPCDARFDGNNCRMYQDICEALPGPNGKMCKWTGKSPNSAGNNFPMDGSPCVPDGEPEDITMQMINVGNGNQVVELGLGERGVIKFVDVKFGNVQGRLDSEKCFSEGGAAAWGLDELPDDWIENRIDNELVSWWIKDSASSTLVRAVCLRTVDKGQNGLPRINVQEVAVEPEKNGKGFCFTDSIGEKNGEYHRSEFIHQSCTQNETTALQGCKFLVEMGTPKHLLPECGVAYCSNADIANEDACLSSMSGKGSERANVWVNYYCEAVMNSPKSPETAPANIQACKKQVNKEGWPTAVALYGNGHKTSTSNPDQGGPCGTKISEYKVMPTDAQCEQGVAIQTLDPHTDEWVTQYFVPVSKPFCDGALEISYTESPKLFSHQVRVEQCDAKMNDSRCAAVSSCAPSFGANFQMSYSSSVTNIDDLLDQNLLQCVDKEMSDGTISNTWCFPESWDYTPVDKVCPCPDRRALGEELFLGAK